LKRSFASASVAALALASAATAFALPAAKPAHPTKHAPAKHAAPKLSKWQQHIQAEMHDSAPGDEYFGRLKMSFLGINNTFRDDAIRAGAYTTDQRIISHVSFADEALNAWARKYPHDPQLARSYFLAFEMYRKVWVQAYQQKAWNYAHVVIEKWPGSYFGKLLKKDLSIGYTEHYFATPVECAALVTPPVASPSPGASTSPLPSPSPIPTPTTAPSARPSNGPSVDVLPVPCLTPSPSPAPLPTGSPLPAGTPLPVGSPLPTASP
jgi:hypothetical protein